MARPHPFEAENGLNFRQSVYDSNSALVKVLYYLHNNNKSYAVSKKSIMTDVFNKGHLQPSGWRPQFFALMKRHGFVGTLRHGRVTYYFITDTGKRILERLGMA